MTREMAKKNGMDKGDNLAFHLIQSFKPGEVDAETAHRLGQQFANEVLKGKYEYVISTHVDKNHIHNHIIFNAASFVDHHKYVSNKRSYHKICVAPAGKPSYVLQLIKQSGLPSTMRNFYKKCS